MDAKRVCALGKVEEPCWKNCTGEWQVKLAVMWGSRRGEKLQTNRGEERETSQQHPLYFFFYIVVFFILAWRKVRSGESERFPVLLLHLLSPSTTKLNNFIFLSSPSRIAWVAWGYSASLPAPSLSLPSTSLSHNPFLCSLSFLFFHPFLSW